MAVVAVFVAVPLIALIGFLIFQAISLMTTVPPIVVPPSSIVTPPVTDTVTPPPTEPQTQDPVTPITTPEKGSAQRQEMMDAARVELGVEGAFTVSGLFVQGDHAVGILIPNGTTERQVVAWTKIEGQWDVGVSGPPDDPTVMKLLQNAESGFSPELLAKIGL